MRPSRSFRTAAILVPLLTTATVVAASERHAERLAGFREFVEQRMELDRIPGMTIGFIKDDFTWVEGFGYADLENRVPAKPESAYRLASVTKPMTAIGVLKLVEQGKLDLDAEVQAYVPYFPAKPWPVTVRPLLGHLGGISHYKNYDDEGHFKDHKDTREAIAVFKDFDLVAEPGTRFHYSSYGFNLLGAIIEGAAGKPYGEYMREVLWGPLGMDATRMDDPDAIIPNRVRGYRFGPDGEVSNSEFVNISSRFAAGGTRSTVVDLLRFARGLMEGRVLSPESYDLMFTSMATRDGRSTGYGMGWVVDPVNGRFHVRHSGGQAETRTLFLYWPRLRFAIAIATNLEGADRTPYVRELYRRILGESHLPPVYTGARETDQIYRAMEAVFEHGLAHWDRYRRPLVSDPAELDAAFRYFADAVDVKTLAASFEESRQKIEDGRHPVAGRPFVAVGSSIAALLAEKRGERFVESLHGAGPIPLFHAWASLRRSEVPKARRAPKALARRVAAWHDDWERTWSAAVREIDIRPDADPDALAAGLRDAFAGAAVVPDFVGRLSDLAFARFQAGDASGATRAASLALELYPRSADANVLAALASLGGGDRERASALIAAAHEIDPGGPASAGSLNGLAYNFRGSGFTELGLALLEVAAELHPDVANLHDSIGEFLLALGQRQRAIASYERALEVDPGFANAKRVLESLRAEPGE